jgi:hypothetical protein
VTQSEHSIETPPEGLKLIEAMFRVEALTPYHRILLTDPKYWSRAFDPDPFRVYHAGESESVRVRNMSAQVIHIYKVDFIKPLDEDEMKWVEKTTKRVERIW